MRMNSDIYNIYMRLMHIKNVEGRNRDEKFKFAVNCTNPYVRSLQYNFFICFFFLIYNLLNTIMAFYTWQNPKWHCKNYNFFIFFSIFRILLLKSSFFNKFFASIRWFGDCLWFITLSFQPRLIKKKLKILLSHCITII